MDTTKKKGKSRPAVMTAKILMVRLFEELRSQGRDLVGVLPRGAQTARRLCPLPFAKVGQDASLSSLCAADKDA